MPKATYVYVHRRISMALAPELSEAEAAEAAEEDWVDDSGWLGQVQNEIAFDNYAGGLFGVADMWTESVDELEYVIFLNKLFRRVTVLRETRLATLLVAVARPLCMRTRIRPRPPRRHRAAGPTPHARPSPPLQRASAQRALFRW